MTVGCADSLPLSNSFRLVTPASLIVVSIAAAAIVAAAIALVALAVVRRGTSEPAAPAGESSWRRAAVWMSVLFLIVFSGKLLLMRETPVTAPFWDQWDGEAALLVSPFQQCTLSWTAMVSAHNEHRVFFTRLLALDLLLVNGQWDPRLEQVVDASIHALIAVLVAAVFWLAGRRRRLELLVLLCAATFALPFAWENTLAGFQSAFYFLLLFSVLALWLTTTNRPGSRRWWLGWVCAVCGLFSAASGPLISVSIAGVVALKLVDDPRRWRDSLLNLGTAAAVLAFDVLVVAPAASSDPSLGAQTPADFAKALGQALAWPWIRQPLLSLVMWLPFAALLLAILRRQGRATDEEHLAAGLGVWVVLHAVALAYGRGGTGALPASRYMDFLSLGIVANVIALMALYDRLPAGEGATRVAVAALSAWLVFAFVGGDRLMAATVGDLGIWRPYFLAHASNVRRFVITDDLAAFLAKRPLVEIPYPDPMRLATLLRDPDIRRMLPGSVREPIRVEPQSVTNQAFVPDGSPVGGQDPFPRMWGSYAAHGRASAGRFESQALPACKAGGSLQFQVSGYLGMPHHYLAVKELASGRETPVRPSSVPREGWLTKAVDCPTGAFAIVAVDANPDSWFAFREPVEIGRGSLMSEWLIARSWRLLFGSLALALLAVGARWFPASASS